MSKEQQEIFEEPLGFRSTKDGAIEIFRARDEKTILTFDPLLPPEEALAYARLLSRAPEFYSLLAKYVKEKDYFDLKEYSYQVLAIQGISGLSMKAAKLYHKTHTTELSGNYSMKGKGN